MSCISSTGLLHITQIVRIKTGLDAGRGKKQDFWLRSPDHVHDTIRFRIGLRITLDKSYYNSYEHELYISPGGRNSPLSGS
jgi:hypothetical protein